MRAYARWTRVRRYDAPAAWVRKVALNRSLDLLRSDQRRRTREERTAELDGPAREWSRPDIGTDLDGDLHAALAALPERQRMAVALHYVADMSVRDVADAMGISEGAVKFNLHQGRARLAEILATSGSQP